MNLKQLLEAINNKKVELKNHISNDDMEKARTCKEELDQLQEKFEMMKDLEGVKPEGLQPIPNKPEDSIKNFANAIRERFKNMASEGTSADGGYTVPEDIRTQIEEYRTAEYSLESEVDVEAVKTKSGARTYKKKAQHKGFSTVEEKAKMKEVATPQFERLEYDVKKYSGYLPVTNELLEDTDANLVEVVKKWLADESRTTRNLKIIAQVKTKTAVTIAGLKDIKQTLNVKLGQAYKDSSKIYTNDDGFNYLDTLEDKNGRPLLNPSLVEAGKTVLTVGAKPVKIEVLPNDILASDVATKGKRKMPFIIGDLKEGIKIFDRKKLQLSNSSVAQVGELNAFEDDLTIYKGTERLDFKIKDKDAFEFCELTTDDATVTGA